MKRIIIASILLLAVGFSQNSYVNKNKQVRLAPRMLNYQGYLTDTLGNPVANPAISMTFAIYDAASAGIQKWTETQGTVSVDKGIFSVLLGSVTPIPDSVFTASTYRWLELSVAGQTLSPRTRITSAGYAYSALYSDTSDYARNVPSGGVPSGYCILGSTSIAPANYSFTGTYVVAKDTGTASELWNTRATMPTARYGCATAEVNGKIYVFGGEGATNKVEEYDPVSNSWVTMADMPTARRYPAAAAVNGKIYVMGGVNSGLVNVVEEYDPSLNTWTTKAPMPTARMWLCAVAVNGKIYAIGGFNGGYLTTNEEYDPEHDTWATKASMPVPRDELAAAEVNGLIYVVGGWPNAYWNRNDQYNPVLDTWTSRANMPTPRYGLVAAVLNGKIYAIGGYTSSYLNTNEEYNPLTNTWAGKSVMPTARRYASAAAVNGKIYVIGGSNGGYLNTNEAYWPGSVDKTLYVHVKN
jgi:N-acetylneuraminic acid mutarotase